jgi:hypothetical protein
MGTTGQAPSNLMGPRGASNPRRLSRAWTRATVSVGIALLSLTPSACWLGDAPESAQRDAEVEPDVGPTETDWPWGQPELRSTELHSGSFVRFAVADTHLAEQLGVELTINGQPYDLLTIDNLELAALYLDDHVGTLEIELRIGNARYTYTATLHDAPAVASVEEFLGAWTSGISADLATIDDPEVRLAGQQNLAMLETSLQELDIEQKSRLVTILLANGMLPTSYARAACAITTPEEWTGCFRSQLIDAIEAAGVALVGISAGLGLSTFLGPLAPVVVFASATYSAVHVMQLLDTLRTIGARAVSRVADEVVLKAVIGEVQGFSPGAWFDYTIEGRYVGVADVEPTPDQSVLHSLKTSVREGGAMVRNIFSRLGVVREVPEPTLNITERRVLPSSSFTVAEVTEGWTADIATGAEGGLRLRLDYVSGDNRNSPSVTLRYVHQGVMEEDIYAHFYVAAPDGCDQHGFAADTRMVDTCGNAVLDASETCDMSSPVPEERCAEAGVDCEVRLGESDSYSLERTQFYGPALLSLESRPNMGYIPTSIEFDGGDLRSRSGACERLDLWTVEGEMKLQLVDQDAQRSLVLRESTTVHPESALAFNMSIGGLGSQPSMRFSLDLVVGSDSSGSPATLLDVTNPLELPSGMEVSVSSPSYFRVSSVVVPLAFRDLEDGDRVLVVDGMVSAAYLQKQEVSGYIYMYQGVPVSIASSEVEEGWEHVIEDQTLAVPEDGSVTWDYDHDGFYSFTVSGQREIGVRRSTGGDGDSTVMAGDQAIVLHGSDSIRVCRGEFRGSMTVSVSHMQDEGGRWHVVPSHASSGMDVGMGTYDVNGCSFRGTAPIFVTIDAGEFGCNSILAERDVAVLAGGGVTCDRGISVAGPAIVPMTTSWFGGDDQYAHWMAHVSSGSVVSVSPGGRFTLRGFHLNGPGSLQVAQRNFAEWPWAAWIVDPEEPATAGPGGSLYPESLDVSMDPSACSSTQPSFRTRASLHRARPGQASRVQTPIWRSLPDPALNGREDRRRGPSRSLWSCALGVEAGFPGSARCVTNPSWSARAEASPGTVVAPTGPSCCRWSRARTGTQDHGGRFSGARKSKYLLGLRSGGRAGTPRARC